MNLCLGFCLEVISGPWCRSGIPPQTQKSCHIEEPASEPPEAKVAGTCRAPGEGSPRRRGHHPETKLQKSVWTAPELPAGISLQVGLQHTVKEEGMERRL